jgi:elongation factor 1-delta
MAALHDLAHYDVWLDRHVYEGAELEYHTLLAGQKFGGQSNSSKSTLVNEIAKAREQIQKSLKSEVQSTNNDSALAARLATVEAENQQLKKVTRSLEDLVKKLEGRISALELGKSTATSTTSVPVSKTSCPTKQVNGDVTKADDDDEAEEDDFELFGEDADDEDAERVKQERVKAYEERKSKKPVLIAKSNIILDIKPWDDETDMAELERCVRSIEMEGLLWGSSKLVPLAYTIKKLQISCVVEDDKVSTDDLEEKIMAFDELVQSMDIAAFNKI